MTHNNKFPIKLHANISVGGLKTRESDFVNFAATRTGDQLNLTTKVRLMLKSNSEGKCVNAFEVLSKPEILKDAYETIKSKSGNMVPGSDKVTLDGISEA
jgi:hypothetical protein